MKNMGWLNPQNRVFFFCGLKACFYVQKKTQFPFNTVRLTVSYKIRYWSNQNNKLAFQMYTNNNLNSYLPSKLAFYKP